MASRSSTTEYDVIIVGAGISGINFAYRLQERNPNLSFTILESRAAIGGTWDLFKYPGIRSDSDLYTFGFPWRPWTEQKSIAEGDMIVKYVRESAAMYGIDKKVRFGHHVEEANWSSEEKRWELEVEANGEGRETFRTKFLLFCTGYYVRASLRFPSGSQVILMFDYFRTTRNHLKQRSQALETSEAK
jgi:cation diffusion facilitator CzcD-associated flavoprotein CzcO